MATVLLAGNDRGCVGATTQSLEAHGYTVTACGAVDEAIRTLSARPFDAVVVDMRFPLEPKGGLRILQFVKEHDEAAQVIILTAFEAVQEAIEAMEAGAFMYLPTPPGQEGVETLAAALAAATERALELRREWRASRRWIAAINELLERRFPYHREHVQNVGRLVLAMAAHLGWPQERRRHAWEAAMVHDIGKLAVPGRSALRAGSLSSYEKGIVNACVEAGRDILEKANHPDYVVEAVYQHRERYDGDSSHPRCPAYPGKYRGDAIDPIARMISVADAYDAMTNARPYRPRPLTRREALAAIAAERGRQFHPEAVGALLAVVEGHQAPTGAPPAKEGVPPGSGNRGLDVPHLSLEQYLALSPEERDRVHIQAYEGNRCWIERTLGELGAEWILVLNGEVRQWSRDPQEYPSDGDLMQLAEEADEVPFVFIRSPLVEESTWSTLDGEDFYPTLEIRVGGHVLVADFDTGSPRTLLDHDWLDTRRVAPSVTMSAIHVLRHLGFPYRCRFLPIRLEVVGENGARSEETVHCRCVLDWRTSPWCSPDINPNREALAGRDMFRAFGLTAELDGRLHKTRLHVPQEP